MPVSNEGTVSWNQEFLTHWKTSQNNAYVIFEIRISSNGLPETKHDRIVVHLHDIEWKSDPEAIRSHEISFALNLPNGGFLYLYLFQEALSSEANTSQYRQGRNGKDRFFLFAL